MADGGRCAGDVVLMFEGGGMRASYTAGAAATLIEQGISFGHVCGVSAGSSHTVNFLSGDIWRTRESFVGFAENPEFGGVGSFLRGRGLFSAEWIYEKAGLPGGVLPFCYEVFEKNPTPCSIQAFDRDSGESVVWHREDLGSIGALMRRVRASSTLPLVMPPVCMEGRTYFDGGLGVGAGIPLQLALDSGCGRIFAVLTRPKGYRKPPVGPGAKATALCFAAHPRMREALLTRNERYNAELERLEALAAEGRAYIVYAEGMAVENDTRDVARLRESYRLGYAQAQRDLPKWLEWLF